MQVLLMSLLNFYSHVVFLNFFFTGTFVVARTYSRMRCQMMLVWKNIHVNANFTYYAYRSSLSNSGNGLEQFYLFLKIFDVLFYFSISASISTTCSSTEAICFCIDLRIKPWCAVNLPLMASFMCWGLA